MSAYQPGVCNIGPAEIAQRRKAGHVAAAVSVSLLSVLIATHAPRWSRVLVGLPAAGAASGYLQANAHFCAGFGSRGLYNFGPVGVTQEVADPESRALDTAKSRRIGLQSVAIGVAVGVAAAALPG